MPAFVSSRLMAAGAVPPPVHCTEPRDLNTMVLGGESSFPPQAIRALNARKGSKYLNVFSPSET
jgi:hypothetical protein